MAENPAIEKLACPSCNKTMEAATSGYGDLKRAKCRYCSESFTLGDARKLAVTGSLKSDLKKCPYCAELINEEAIKCKHCGEIVDYDAKQRDKRIEKMRSEAAYTPKWNKGVAAVLSLVFAGAGQVYNGELSKGVFVVFLVGGAYALSWQMPLTLFIAIPFHLAAIQDAYSKAGPSK